MAAPDIREGLSGRAAEDPVEPVSGGRAPGPVQLFLSAEGRLAKGPFWLAALTLMAMLGAFSLGTAGGVRAVLGWPVGFGLFVSGCCVAAKRLHDRGHAGWWAALPLFALLWAWTQPNPLARGVLSFGVLWALGVLGSQPGWNRFGPEPGAPPR